MRTYSSLVIGLAAALISTGALAATTSSINSVPDHATHKPNKEDAKMGEPVALADRCSALAVQFDRAVAVHGNAAKIEAAKSLRASGAAECGSGQATAGIRSLTQALKDIGVKVRA